MPETKKITPVVSNENIELIRASLEGLEGKSSEIDFGGNKINLFIKDNQVAYSRTGVSGNTITTLLKDENNAGFVNRFNNEAKAIRQKIAEQKNKEEAEKQKSEKLAEKKEPEKSELKPDETTENEVTESLVTENQSQISTEDNIQKALESMTIVIDAENAKKNFNEISDILDLDEEGTTNQDKASEIEGIRKSSKDTLLNVFADAAKNVLLMPETVLKIDDNALGESSSGADLAKVQSEMLTTLRSSFSFLAPKPVPQQENEESSIGKEIRENDGAKKENEERSESGDKAKLAEAISSLSTLRTVTNPTELLFSGLLPNNPQHLPIVTEEDKKEEALKRTTPEVTSSVTDDHNKEIPEDKKEDELTKPENKNNQEEQEEENNQEEPVEQEEQEPTSKKKAGNYEEKKGTDWKQILIMALKIGGALALALAIPGAGIFGILLAAAFLLITKDIGAADKSEGVDDDEETYKKAMANERNYERFLNVEKDRDQKAVVNPKEFSKQNLEVGEETKIQETKITETKIPEAVVDHERQDINSKIEPENLSKEDRDKIMKVTDTLRSNVTSTNEETEDKKTTIPKTEIQENKDSGRQ